MCLFSSLQILSIGLCWSIGSSFRSMETAIWCEYDLEKILQDLLIEIGWEIWWMRWLIIFKFHVDSVWNLHTIEGASWLLFSTFSNRLIDMLLSNYFCIYVSSLSVYYNLTGYGNSQALAALSTVWVIYYHVSVKLLFAHVFVSVCIDQVEMVHASGVNKL